MSFRTCLPVLHELTSLAPGRLIRRSKRVAWGGDSNHLIAFVFRTNDSYERGLDYEWAQAAAEEAGQEFFLPEGVEEEVYQLDTAMYRVVEQKLGAGLHDWTSFEYFDLHPEAMSVSFSFSAMALDGDNPFDLQIEFISTAFYLAIVPPSLDQALVIFGSVKGSLPADVAEQALTQLFKIVSGQVGRKAFRFWSPDVPPPSTKSKILPDAVHKFRLYCYWLDGEATTRSVMHILETDRYTSAVVTYHLRTCNPLLEAIISATFLRILESIQLLVNDSKVSVVDFEKAVLKVRTYTFVL